MNPADPITRAEALIRANALHRAAYELGMKMGAGHANSDEVSAAGRYLLLADVERSTRLTRARDVAARVTDLNRLDEAHPGMSSQEPVAKERERLIAEIERLMGGSDV